MYSRSPANMHVAGTSNGLQLPWEYQCPSAMMPTNLHMDRLKGHPLESLRLLQNASLMVQSRIASDQRFMPLDMSFNQYGLSPFSYPYFKYFASEPKPTQSYIGLIAMAILSSKGRKLVLSDIYQWILDNFPYFRTRGPGWRNSIRHNLSLNDCFMKSGRSPNGKGHFWAIHPACVDDFAKGDYRRRKAQRKVRNSSDTNDHEEEECSRTILCSESDDASEKDEAFMDKEIDRNEGEIRPIESVIRIPETESHSHHIVVDRMDKGDNSEEEISPKPEKQNVSRPFDMDNLLSRDSKSSSGSHDAIIRMSKQKYLWTERFSTQ